MCDCNTKRYNDELKIKCISSVVSFLILIIFIGFIIYNVNEKSIKMATLGYQELPAASSTVWIKSTN